MKGIKTEPETIDTIVTLLMKGCKQKDIARQLGICTGTVNKISVKINSDPTEIITPTWFPSFRVRWEDMQKLFKGVKGHENKHI